MLDRFGGALETMFQVAMAFSILNDSPSIAQPASAEGGNSFGRTDGATVFGLRDFAPKATEPRLEELSNCCEWPVACTDS
jgi:hypothetical protein